MKLTVQFVWNFYRKDSVIFGCVHEESSSVIDVPVIFTLTYDNFLFSYRFSMGFPCVGGNCQGVASTHIL